MNNCPLCAGSKRVLLYHIPSDYPFTIREFSIVSCDDCGLVRTEPVPPAHELESFYAHQSQQGYQNAVMFESYIRNENNRLLDRLDAHFPKRGKLLDAGCGMGYLLQAARERGWEVTGLDSSKYAVDFNRNQHGIEVLETSLKNCPLPAASFDIVVLSQIIEHTADPRSLLADAARLLKPDGLLYIVTPNAESAVARVKKEKFNYWIPPEHLVHYAPRTLRQVLEKNSLKVLDISTLGHDFDAADLLSTYFNVPFQIGSMLGKVLYPFLRRCLPQSGSMVQAFSLKE